VGDVHEGHIFAFELAQYHAFHLRWVKGAEVREEGNYHMPLDPSG
jgi:hypothetical protein